MNSPLDAKFFALSDPTRRAILQRLTAGDASVAELAAPFAMSPRAVAKHVRVLESAGLVTRRKVAQQNLAAMQPAALGEMESWLAQYRAFWSGRFERLGQRMQVKGRAK